MVKFTPPFLLAAAVGTATLPAGLASHRSAAVANRAACTVNSVADVDSVSSCSSVVINSFTVSSGTTINLKFAKGAHVTMNGDITFAKTTSSGPLITFDGSDITFNGNGYKLNGKGDQYWDGLGANGGVNKPHPFVKISMDGAFENLTVLNSPAHAISVSNSAKLLIHGVTVDDSAGDKGNLGHNTDGFDISANNVMIHNCTVKNQDDCIAICSGSNIVIQQVTCIGGHGISIGSISSGRTVSNVTISDNIVKNSMYGLRIKTKTAATNGAVRHISYSGNTVSGISKYGVLITQSYPKDFDEPGTGTTISDISFSGKMTSVSVNDKATRIGVNCGNCEGEWNWDSLSAAGGTGNKIVSSSASITGLSSY